MFVICRPDRLYIFFDCSLKKNLDAWTGQSFRHRIPGRSEQMTEQWFADSTRSLCESCQELVRLGGKPNNSSVPSPVRASTARKQLGNKANNRRVLRLFLASCQGSTGQPERTIIRFTPSWVKKRTKKTRAKSSGVFRTISFLCN